MNAITIQLDAAEAEALEALVKQTGLPAEEVLRDAMSAYSALLSDAGQQPELTQEQVAQIEEGLEALRRGETFAHEDVMAEARRLVGL